MVSFPVFINICVTENGCKVDITRKNIYNCCDVNLTFGGTMKNRMRRKPRITEDGIDYILVGDYYIPDMRLPEEHRSIGKYGRMHQEYLREV